MKIDHSWLPFILVDVANCVARNLVGKQPEIAATTNRPVLAPNPEGGRRKFENLSCCGGLPIRKAFSVRHAIQVVSDWKHRRVIREALFGQNVERPEGLFDDG